MGSAVGGPPNPAVRSDPRSGLAGAGADAEVAAERVTRGGRLS